VGANAFYLAKILSENPSISDPSTYTLINYTGALSADGLTYTITPSVYLETSQNYMLISQGGVVSTFGFESDAYQQQFATSSKGLFVKNLQVGISEASAQAVTLDVTANLVKTSSANEDVVLVYGEYSDNFKMLEKVSLEQIVLGASDIGDITRSITPTIVQDFSATPLSFAGVKAFLWQTSVPKPLCGSKILTASEITEYLNTAQ
jgi:hypothetical protein